MYERRRLGKVEMAEHTMSPVVPSLLLLWYYLSIIKRILYSSTDTIVDLVQSNNDMIVPIQRTDEAPVSSVDLPGAWVYPTPVPNPNLSFHVFMIS